MKFCSECGHGLEVRVPPGDEFPRAVCPACGTIHYVNPKIITGVIPVAADGRVLLCRRDIEPRRGFWTFPAGFMELNESAPDGAAREAREEARARVEVDRLQAVLSVPHVQQVHLMHVGRLLNEDFGPTHESSEVGLYAESQVGELELAFPTVWHAMNQFFADRRDGAHRVLSRTIQRPPGGWKESLSAASLLP